MTAFQCDAFQPNAFQQYGGNTGVAPPAPVIPVEAFSGGWEPVRRRRSKKEVIEERKALGITVEPEITALPILQILPSKRLVRKVHFEREPAIEADPLAIAIAIQQAKRRRRLRDEDELLLLF